MKILRLFSVVIALLAMQSPLQSADIYRHRPPSANHQTRVNQQVRIPHASESGAKRLSGALVYCDAWSDLQEKPFGIYSFTSSDLAPSLSFSITTEILTGTEANGRFYAVERRADRYNMLVSIKFFCYDSSSGTLLWEKQVESPTYSKLPVIITYDPSADLIYALTYSDDSLQHVLATFDPESGTLNPIGTMGYVDSMPGLLTLSADGHGSIFSIANTGELWKINTADASMESVGNLGVTPQYIQSSVYDEIEGCLWWAASFGSGEGSLYKVNPADASSEKIGIFPSNEEFVGLYLTDGSGVAGAPARISNLQFNPSSPDYTSGTLDFTVPSETCGGDPISETLNVTVSLSDETFHESVLDAGTSVSLPATLSPGMNRFIARTSNSAGVSPVASLSFWAGKDSPAPVSDLTFYMTGTTGTISWKAPTGGEHGGLCDLTGMSYRVVRSDGKICAQSTTETSITDILPEIIDNYYYDVTPVLADGTEGKTTRSNVVRFGSGYSVPKIFDFNYDEDFNNDFSIIDNNEDGSTWSMSYTWDDNVAVAQYNCSWQNDADDWLYFPGLILDSDKIYQIDFDHSFSQWGSYTENITLHADKTRDNIQPSITVSDFQDILADGTSHKNTRLYVPESGNWYISFHITSPANQTYFFIDNVNITEVGLAGAPAKCGMSLENVTENGGVAVKISVKCPVNDLSGAPLNSLTSVEVRRGGALVHTFSAPSVGEELVWIDTESGVGPVSYTVVAVNALGEGEPLTEDVFVGGYPLPYSADFSNVPDLDFFSVLNLNGDDKTWNLTEGEMVYEYNMFEDANDWLLSPGISLSEGRVYKLITTVRTNDNKESLDIAVGTGENVEQYRTLTQLSDFKYVENTDVTSVFDVAQSGVHHLGFHAISPKNRLRVYIPRFVLTDMASVKAPAAADDFTAVADPSGLNKVSLSVTVPSKTYEGADAGTLSALNIYRGAELVHTFDNPTAGTTLTWDDENAPAGMVFYSARAVNDAGEGIEAVAETYVGEDTPAPVEVVVVKGVDDNSNALLTWEAPKKGIHGGYVNPNSLKYDVSRTVNWSTDVVATDLTSPEFKDVVNNTEAQQSYSYVVRASNSYGSSVSGEFRTSLGLLKEYPLQEIFTGYSLNSEWASYTEPETGFNGSWMLTDNRDGVTGSDSESGFMVFCKWNDTTDPCVGTVVTPKVKLEGSTRPFISLSAYHNPELDSRTRLSVYCRVNDGEKTLLESIDLSDGEAGWRAYSWPVNAESSDYLNLYLEAATCDRNSSVFFDNVMIDDVTDYNMSAVSLEGPSELGVDGGVLNFTVVNKGNKTADGYDVRLLRDDVEILSFADNHTESGVKRVFEFTLPAPDAADQNVEHAYHAEIIYADDEQPVDNISATLVIKNLQSPYPRVTGLTGNSSEGNVNLSWNEPSLEWNPSSCESFEDLTPFAIENFPNWILYDGDGQRTVGIRYGLTFDNWYAPKAWQAWDPSWVGLEGKDVATHSGNMCLMSMMSDGSIPGVQDQGEPVNDDWLISEPVSPGSLVSFWLMQPTDSYGNEGLQILWSDGAESPDDFELLAEIELNNKAEWNYYSYQLPEEAGRFALRHHKSNFGLWLDDITYSPLRNKSTLEVECYNVYRNGKLYASTPACSMCDATPLDGSNSYAVAPKFTLGEGALSETIEITTEYSGVTNTSDHGIVITAGRGFILITADNDCDVTLMSPDGSVLSHGRTAAGKLRFNVSTGVYLVKAGHKTAKLMVR